MAQKPTRDLGVKERPTLAQKRSRSDTRHTENIYAKFYKGKLNVNNMLQPPGLQKSSRKLVVRKTFKCGVCHVTFSSMRIASRHVEYYRQPKYPCEECGTKFADTRQLEFHVTYTHGEVKNLAMYKLQCPVCKQMAGTKTFLQSHLYHYHNEWAVKNPMNQNTFASKSISEGTKTSADIEEAKIMKSPRMISMLKDPKHTSRSSMSVPRAGSANSQQARHTSTSSSFSKQDIGVPLAKTRGSPVVFETVLNGIKVEACDDEPEDSGRFSIPNRPSENDCDEMLRALHSCKECYVPLPRIRVSRTTTEKEKRPEEVEKEKRPEETEEEKRPEETEEEKRPEEIEQEKLPKKIEQEKRPEEIGEVARTEDYSNDFEATSLDELCLDDCPIKSEPEEFVESSAECLQLQNTTFSSRPAKTAASKSKKNHAVVRIASKICDKYFPSKRAMQRHFRQRHMIVAEDVVYCVCGKTLPGRREKEKHFYDHCGEIVTASAADTIQSAFASCRLLEKKHECPKCGEKFWLETCQQDHQDRCRSVKTGASVRLALTMELHCRYEQMSRSSAHHVCTQCNTGFNSSSTLWQHKQKYGGSEGHQCPICKTLFSGRRLLKGHIQSAHESSRKKLYSIFCEICSQGFTKNLYKRIHIMHCHSIEVEKSIKGTELIVVRSSLPEPPKIDTCDTAQASDAPSEAEETPAPPTPPKSSGPENRCPVCNIVFVSRKRFMDHMIYYKKNEIVYCGICSKDLRGQYVAHHHNKKFHYSRDMQNSYTHRCTICQDGFMYRTHLQAHVSHVHGNALRNPSLLSGEDRSGAIQSCKPEAVRSTVRHSCPVCEILFPTAAALMKHQTQYSNDGDFACNQCPRKCPSAAMLLDHIALNHSDGVVVDGGVKCSRCNEYFLTRAGWVSHVKHFHNSDGDEPSEFCFESNLTSSREFGNVEIELIPMNDAISSGMSYINYGSLIDLTGREGAKPACSTRVEALGPTSTTSGTRNEGKIVEKIRTNCGTCGFACSGTAELADHMGLYSNTGRYKCIICDRRFLWRRFFEDHKKKHFRHSPEDVNFCRTCGEGFEKIADMRIHEAHLHRACNDIDETNGLPAVSCTENSAAESTNGKDRSQTEQDKVPFAYECPICKRKFPTEDALDAHLTTADKHEGEGHSSNSGEGPAICVICDMVFVSKKLLRIHESKFHSSVAAKPPTPRQCPEAGDRFYVLAGAKILPEAVEVLKKNFDRCNKRLGLTNTIYRYGPSYKCDICDIVVSSKDSLNVHQTKIHTVSSNVRIDSENEEQSSTEISVVEKTLPASSGLGGNEASTPQQGTVDPPKKTVLPTFTKSILKSVSTISETRVTHYRCKICDLIFVNKNLLRVHKVNGNCVKGSIERTDGDRPDKEKACVTEEPQTLMNSPPVESEKTSVRPAVGPNISTLSPNRMRFISLPPGNYRVGKLNVRPFGKIVQNLIKQTGHKRKNEIAKNPAPVAAKRVKKVFDPVAYRELCRQHNLIPTAVSPEVTTPKNLCEKFNCTDCCAINQFVKEKKCPM